MKATEAVFIGGPLAGRFSASFAGLAPVYEGPVLCVTDWGDYELPAVEGGEYRILDPARKDGRSGYIWHPAE